MTNTWSNERIVDFINDVHLHPELWDIKAGVYKDRNLKKDGWAEIAEKFLITSNEAYKKFRSLRTYANNEEKKKKSGSAGGKLVKWFAFDAISFILTQNTANTGLDTENVTGNAETTDTDMSADPGEAVETETTDSFEAIDTTPKPRAKRAKTTDPLLEKAQNIIRNAGEKSKNEYSAFGEHIANKLSKYDECTRAQAELKIMKILFQCDMTMYRTRARTELENSRDGVGTSHSQYSDISTHQDDFEYMIVPESDDNADQDETRANLSYEEVVSFTVQNDEEDDE